MQRVNPNNVLDVLEELETKSAELANAELKIKFTKKVKQLKLEIENLLCPVESEMFNSDKANAPHVLPSGNSMSSVAIEKFIKKGCLTDPISNQPCSFQNRPENLFIKNLANVYVEKVARLERKIQDPNFVNSKKMEEENQEIILRKQLAELYSEKKSMELRWQDLKNKSGEDEKICKEEIKKLKIKHGNELTALKKAEEDQLKLNAEYKKLQIEKELLLKEAKKEKKAKRVKLKELKLKEVVPPVKEIEVVQQYPLIQQVSDKPLKIELKEENMELFVQFTNSTAVSCIATFAFSYIYPEIESVSMLTVILSSGIVVSCFLPGGYAGGLFATALCYGVSGVPVLPSALGALAGCGMFRRGVQGNDQSSGNSNLKMPGL